MSISTKVWPGLTTRAMLTTAGEFVAEIKNTPERKILKLADAPFFFVQSYEILPFVGTMTRILPFDGNSQEVQYIVDHCCPVQICLAPKSD